MQVKQEVEGDPVLKPVLLTNSLTKVAQFAKDTGMHAHLAPRLLPLCTYISQSVQLQENALFQLAQGLDIAGLLFTPEQMQAIQEQLQHGQVCHASIGCCIASGFVVGVRCLMSSQLGTWVHLLAVPRKARHSYSCIVPPVLLLAERFVVLVMVKLSFCLWGMASAFRRITTSLHFRMLLLLIW